MSGVVTDAVIHDEETPLIFGVNISVMTVDSLVKIAGIFEEDHDYSSWFVIVRVCENQRSAGRQVVSMWTD